jgi:outer membrane receptor protein involved in Fe transport
MRLGRLTINAGVRWDHYRLIVSDHAFSPRLGVAWFIPSARLVLRGSYDRAFQTPAIENLLLASSPQLEQLNENVLRLPVPPSRGDFYQAGFVKQIFDHLRLEANWFRRSIREFSDDDLLLNTGVSFPIAFARANIHGIEAKLEVPRWGPVSAFISYANMTGTGQLPITGGLFLEEGATELLQSNARFPITQDQRNTARARVRYQIAPRLWAAISSSYGSGLPVELEDGAPVQATPRVLERVNLERGRVRPSFTLDASAGAQLWRHERRSVNLQADVSNITNRLNVINFAGVFSGTAVAPPRSYGVRLRAEF